jgi:hypothetical protein
MGFYLRKSLSVGPLRFNLSKSGIGVSAGIKGLRIGTGPRGNYIHMGRGGLYYRATLPKSNVINSSNLPPPVQVMPEIGDATHDPFVEIDSSDVLAMTDSSSAQLLDEINSKRKKAKLWPLGIITGIIGFFCATKLIPVQWAFILSIPTTLVITIALCYQDQLRKSTVLFYHLDQNVESLYQSLHDAFDNINLCPRIWHIEADAKVKDIKYHAGAGYLVKRKEIRINKGNAPYIKTNITVPAVPVGSQTLYFFPDRLIVIAPNGVGAIQYNCLDLDISETNFIEDEEVPQGAKVVGRTWRYVNKGGGPDRRFKDNPELPILRYEQLHFMSASGLKELLHLSSLGKSMNLKSAIIEMAKRLQDISNLGDENKQSDLH